MVQLNGVSIVSKFDDGDTVTIEIPDQSPVSDIDSQNITAATDNCEAWFEREVPKKTLETAYTSSLKDSTMNVSKATVNGKVVTRIYDSTRAPVDPCDVGEMQKCDVILEYSGLWFAKKTFGPIWRIAQVRIRAKPKSVYPDEYLFQGDDSDQGENETDADFM